MSGYTPSSVGLGKNFGFLTQPLNKLCILQHCKPLGFNTKTPAVMGSHFSPQVGGWGQSRMKMTTKILQKKKKAGAHVIGAF